MHILVVGSYNSHHGKFAPFIEEQIRALQAQGVQVSCFGIVGHGIRGYMRSLRELKRKIKEEQPALIHAHYGLTGLLANMQRHVPVVTTYHGSDINLRLPRILSKIAMRLSAWNIFVDKKTMQLAQGECLRNHSLIPCGVDLGLLMPSKTERVSKVLEPGKKHVLFAGAFDNSVKNAPLAQAAVGVLNAANEHVQLVEMKGYTRAEVTELMYACDALLMTSHTEGSPQVIKEALACGLPVVSVDVGDVQERISGVDGCWVAVTRQQEELADLLQQAVNYGRTQGREKVINDELDNQQIASKLQCIYENIVRYTIH